MHPGRQRPGCYELRIMLYGIIDGIVAYGADVVLENLNFEVKNKKEKIAVIGRNGCGKTTLLKVITKEMELTKADGNDGRIVMTGRPTIGYLKQITFEDLNVTLDEEIRKVFDTILAMKSRLEELVKLMEDGAADSEQEQLAAEYTQLHEEFTDIGGYYYEKEYDMMLRSFGFDISDKQKQLSQFSGGQLTKLAFIKLLLSKPDILLLDEPTNHLDISTIAWLEQYLNNYPRAVVIVSHDRMFLDRIVNTVYEIAYGQIVRYNGNYSDFVRIKKERYNKQLKDHIAQQKEIERLTQIIERFKNKPTKVAMTRSKLKAIEHMELIERPADYDTKSFHASFKPKLITGHDVLLTNDLIIGYDKPLAKVSIDLKSGERLGIIGDNGIGKSTLLKTLVGETPAISGDFRFGVNVQIGYFDQRMAQYTSDRTVIDDFWDMYPTMTQTEVRNALGAFLFTQDEVFKDVAMLSGGERVRLCLAKIFHSRPNVLILDEPTNHMDLIGKETLETMLREFEGTVIFVSHDRFFVRQVATQLLEMKYDKVTLYPFGYDDYEEKVNASLQTGTTLYGREAAGCDGTDKAAGNNSIQNENVSLSEGQSSYQAGKDIARKKKKIAKLEEQIAEYEAFIDNIKTQIADPANASDYVKLQELQNEADEKEQELLECMEEWEELCATI